MNKKDYITNKYIKLKQEKLSLSFDNFKKAFFYDEATKTFICSSLQTNWTLLEAKTSKNTLLWHLEVPGNAPIVSVKVSPDLSTVAIQRSSYYIEFVMVTLHNTVINSIITLIIIRNNN